MGEGEELWLATFLGRVAILTRSSQFFSPSFEENEGISYGKLLGHEHSLVSWFKTEFYRFTRRALF